MQLLVEPVENCIMNGGSVAELHALAARFHFAVYAIFGSDMTIEESRTSSYVLNAEGSERLAARIHALCYEPHDPTTVCSALDAIRAQFGPAYGPAVCPGPKPFANEHV